MREREEVVTAVLSAAGNEVVGRVRLQKMVYLLDQLGLQSGFDFDYHNYGPFSRDLENAVSDAKAFDLVAEEQGRRQSDGAPYSIFRLTKTPGAPEFGGLGKRRANHLADLFKRTNVTVLELAATVDWLWRFEKYADWRSEIGRRKSVKVGGGRLDKAVELLRSIDLAPPDVAAH